MAQTFTAQVQRFADLTKSKMEAVVKKSAERVFEAAQTPKVQGGSMPVDTGFLRNSFVAELNGGGVTSGPDAYGLVIANYELGDAIFGGWTAEYAIRMEYGFSGEDALGRTYNQAGNFFALNAAMQWQSIVAQEAERARNMR